MIELIPPAVILAAHLTNLYLANGSTLTYRQAVQKAYQDVKEIQNSQPDGIITAEYVDKWVRQVGISTHNVWNPEVPHFHDGSCPPDDTQDPNYGYIIDDSNCKRNNPHHKY